MRMTRRLFFGLGASSLAGAAYAAVVEPVMRLRVKHYAITPEGWPAQQSLRIAAIADPHVNKPFMPPAHIRDVCRRVNAVAPDLIVLLGDYLSSIPLTERSLAPDEVATSFEELDAPLGVFAVLGNHDWWEDPERAGYTGIYPPAIASALERRGIRVLENEALRLDHRQGPFWLLGLGDQWSVKPGGRGAGRDDLPATLAQVDDDAPAILLAHEPDIFPKVPPRVALTLAGHTHGGQIVLLGYAPKVPSRYGQRYRYGHIVEDGRHLVVSAGVGCGGVPVRFGMPPEITIVDLGPPRFS